MKSVSQISGRPPPGAKITKPVEVKRELLKEERSEGHHEEVGIIDRRK